MASQRRVLVPVDSSEASKYAIEWSTKNVFRPSDAITLLHVVDSPVLMVPSASSTGQQDPLVSLGLNAEAVHARSKDGVRLMRRLSRACVAGGFKVRILVMKGDVKETILDVAEREHYDLIVVGQRPNVWVGSLSEYLVEAAPCAVNVVRDESLVASTATERAKVVCRSECCG